jgi:glycolate oxidase FAD binding subunit
VSATDTHPLTSAIGQALVRTADGSRDRIDDVLPGIVAEPDSVEGVAETLAWAARERRSVLIEGHGSKRAWGRRPGPVDVLVSLHRLNRIREHAQGDLVASFDAGIALSDANAALGRERQWLPLDPRAAARATIGGIVATNDSGPHRHRYGSPRDLVIGIELVTGAGTRARAGGRVVKNVAGYDLARVMSGSFGCLGAIVGATFKLAPLPEAAATLRVAARNAAELASLAAMVTGSQLEPVACEIAADPRAPEAASRWLLLLRFASVRPAVAAAIDAARELLGRAGAVDLDVLDGPADTALWTSMAEGWPVPLDDADQDLDLRLSWRPAELVLVLQSMADAARQARVLLTGRVALGAGRVIVRGGLDVQTSIVHTLRAAPHVGNVVVASARPDVKALVDVWPGAGREAIVFAALRRAFDPAGILGAGRGPL